MAKWAEVPGVAASMECVSHWTQGNPESKQRQSGMDTLVTSKTQALQTVHAHAPRVLVPAPLTSGLREIASWVICLKFFTST